MDREIKYIRKMSPDYALPVLGFLGLLISLYIVYVEVNLAASAMYQPMCDSETLGVSCSKVFSSNAGHLLSFVGVVPKRSQLDLSNGVLGSIFYMIIFVVPNVEGIPLDVKVWSVLALSIVSSIVSCLLGYVMIRDLKEICIVCSFLYLVNLFILIYAHRWYRVLVKMTRKTKLF